MKFIKFLSDKWNQYSLYSKGSLKFALSILALISLYYVLATPLENYIDETEQKWKTNQELLDWVEPRIEFLKNIKAQEPARLSSEQMLNTLQESLAQSDVKNQVISITTNEQKAVQIQLKAVNFNPLIQWIGAQKTQYGLEVTELSANATDQEGVIDVSFVLDNPPSN